MGVMGGLLGINGGANGTGFASPAAAQINQGTNPQQLQTAYGGAQNSLASQQALLQALQGQGGLANQNQVYGQLQGVANGTGPNPAQAMLANQTGQNTANQAALMAGQRGAGANVGLMARQAAQQGAANQQNAIGQGAALQAQQSLNALAGAGNMANTQAANQIGATTANTQAQQGEQNILQGANTAGNNAAVTMQGNINNANAGLTNTTLQGQQGLYGGMMQGIGQALMPSGGGGAAKAEGGLIQRYDEGGDVSPPVGSPPTLGLDNLNPQPQQQPFNLGVNTNLSSSQVPSGPQSSVGQFQQAQQASAAPSVASPSFSGDSGAQALETGASGLIGGISRPAQNFLGMMSGSGGSGGGGAGMGALAALAQGGNVGTSLDTGGHVPGQAATPGNSYSNDKVKALLSPGELVVDRETMADGGPAGQAARFLSAVISAKKKGKK